ncbi:hypothetical protein [Hyalangium rubrum]|uniref:Uncharacterized protein n=1 Tax=Hyalangium rubrum TaxID=3103134 RepID=A0ABU5HF61_9BACT|nr:hypothetical protein [Hyalangium sp. s54d21]MDY7231886.1 hypothetical protein [Hyalangium sp. s54d21]
MLDSLLRRLAPTVPTVSTTATQTASATPAVTTPAVTTPSPASYFRDGFDLPRATPVSLNGGGNAASIDLPPFLKRLLPDPVGPKLLHLDDGLTPQGQGYDAKRGEVLTTYYDDSGVLLSIQDKKDGSETLNVRLGGKDSVPPPSHGGGVSVDGDNVYVSDTDFIYVYSREAIEKAEREGTVAEPSQVIDVPADRIDPETGTGLVSNGSYMTVKDGYAYVGGYSKDGDGKAGAVWRYKLDERTGELIQNEHSPQGPIRAPDRAQGIAVVDGALLFTTGDHKLVYQPFDTEKFKADIDDRTDISNGKIDPYAQGLNIIDGELWVTYESGSDKYKDDVDHPREHIQRIPLDELDLDAAGLTPEDLQG